MRDFITNDGESILNEVHLRKMDKNSYQIEDPEKLDLFFYEGFDENFIFNKIQTFVLVLDNIPTFQKFIDDVEGPNVNLDGKYIEALRAEIFFSQHHQFEVLFSLMLATYQDLPHWVYLTSYKTRDIKKAVRFYITGDMSKLTGGQVKNERDFVSRSIYSDFKPTDSKQREQWNDNLDNVNWLLKRIAPSYANSTEYNAYKHGLRIITGPSSLKMQVVGQPEIATPPVDSVTYLELEEQLKQPDGKRKTFRVFETRKHFDPIASYNHLFAMRQMLKTIKSTRLDLMKGGKGTNLDTFFNIDKDDLGKMNTRGAWSRQV